MLSRQLTPASPHLTGLEGHLEVGSPAKGVKLGSKRPVTPPPEASGVPHVEMGSHPACAWRLGLGGPSPLG